MTAPAPTGADLLAPETLLLTVVTLLYALWYPDVTAAHRVDPPADGTNLRDTEPTRARQKLSLALVRVIPLMLAALALAMVFAPTALDAFPQRWNLAPFIAAKDRYDPVTTSLVVAWVFSVLLAILGLTDVLRIGSKRIRYQP
jgi:hypothetical protein